MVVKQKIEHNNIVNQKAQALFELIFFLPIFVILIPFFISIGNSFNLSINQQKAARRYFYFLAKGNSKLPGRTDLKAWGDNRLTFASMTSVSFADKRTGDSFFAACSPMTKFLMPNDSENCDSKLSAVSSDLTGFIRVYTSYGICGESYFLNQNSTGGSAYTSSHIGNPSRIVECTVSK